MDHIDILTDFARRPLHTANLVLSGIGADTLHAMPGKNGNSIAWLIWHAARQLDAQVADLQGKPQLWVSGWAERLGQSPDPAATGFGHTHAEVAALRMNSSGDLQDYLTAVVEDLVAYVQTLGSDDLDAIIDESWDPPVRRGVRLVSTIDDAIAHIGQAAYARGVTEDWGIGY